MTTLDELHKKIIDGIREAVIDGAGTKSGEGLLAAEFPAYYDVGFEKVTLKLTLYVFGPSRRYEWKSESLEACILAAERDIDTWLAELRADKGS